MWSNPDDDDNDRKDLMLRSDVSDTSGIVFIKFILIQPVNIVCQGKVAFSNVNCMIWTHSLPMLVKCIFPAVSVLYSAYYQIGIL